MKATYLQTGEETVLLCLAFSYHKNESGHFGVATPRMLAQDAL